MRKSDALKKCRLSVDLVRILYGVNSYRKLKIKYKQLNGNFKGIGQVC